MALIKCSECGKEISDKATHCIHCGCPIQKEEKKYCLECGKELSGNNPECKYCGYKNSFATTNDPTSFTTYDQYKENKEKSIHKIGTLGKIWLFFSMFVYAMYSLIYLFRPIIKINTFANSSVICFLIEILLLLSYYLLYKEMNKKNFYIIVALNILMLLFTVITPSYTLIAPSYSIMNLFSSLFGTILNILLTYLAVKGCLNDKSIDIKSYITKYLVTLFFGICLFITFSNFLNY